MVTSRTYTNGEVARIGREHYERELQPGLDTPENRGRLVALDIASGDYAAGRSQKRTVLILALDGNPMPRMALRAGYDLPVSVCAGGAVRLTRQEAGPPS